MKILNLSPSDLAEYPNICSANARIGHISGLYGLANKCLGVIFSPVWSAFCFDRSTTKLSLTHVKWCVPNSAIEQELNVKHNIENDN